MTMASRQRADFDGDGQAAAVAGDYTALASLIDRTAGWNDVVMYVPEDFDAQVRIYELGCVKLCHLDIKSPMKAVGDGTRDPAASPVSYTHLMLMLSGALAINLPDRCSLILQPQQLCIMPHVARFCNEASTPVELISIMIPNEELFSISGVLRRFVERPISAQAGSAHLFSQFLVNLAKQAPLLDASARVSFADALVHLLKATVVDWAASNKTAREQLYIRTCEIIENNLGNEDLSAAYIAQRMKCSKRFLHLLFSEYNEHHTFNSYVNHRRLSRCRSELLFQKFSGELISTIAHRWGFQDPSYFAKMFRREFGVSPRAYSGTVSSHSDGHEADRS